MLSICPAMNGNVRGEERRGEERRGEADDNGCIAEVHQSSLYRRQHRIGYDRIRWKRMRVKSIDR